jgi:membrane-associated protein
MDIVFALVDFIVHIDVHLAELMQNYGTTLYAILFLIVFCETGLVVTPILPGDSLLFAAGALSMTAGSAVSPAMLIPLLIVAAVVGDAVNFAVGSRVGGGFLEARAGKGWFKLIKPSYLQKAQAFYERHGAKTIVLARFVPIVRTFAPFVAGVGKMPYGRFVAYNIIGAVLWVSICVLAGVFFGQLPFVKDNFSKVALGIVLVSVLPIVVEVIRNQLAARKSKA